MKLLVDTNIFLDIIFKRNQLYEGSKALFYCAYENHDEIYVNASSMKDLYYFSFKYSQNKKLAIKTISQIYSNVTKIIDCSSDDAINAIFDDGDYEDNMIRHSAKRNFCDAIITRNIKNFSCKDVNCLTPEEYLKYRV